MGKWEIVHYKQFLLFPQCFQKAYFQGASKGVIVWEWVNTVFNSISVMSLQLWPVHLSMLSCSSFYQYSFQATGCFPTQPLSTKWRVVREEWILSQWLSSILGKNIGWAWDRTSDLLFSSLQHNWLSYGALQFKIESICKRQIKNVSNNWFCLSKKDRKHCWKKGKYWYPAISPFLNMFFKAFSFRVIIKQGSMFDKNWKKKNV